MNERIDVLAVLDSAANELDREGCQEPNENGDSLMVARAAVAELIEAQRALLAEYGRGIASMRVDAPRRALWLRARDALTRVQGGAE